MFKGTATAVITPFDSNYELDLVAYEKIVSFQLEASIDALVVLGTTGEAPAIDNDEREKITLKTLEKVRKKIPVIVGCGTNSYKKTLYNVKQAEKLGVDGLLIVNPYYNKGTQKSLYLYYKALAEETTLPIMLYNVPSRTGMNIAPETAIKLSEDFRNIVAIKEASSDFSHIAKLFALRNDKLKIYSGNDDTAVMMCLCGGDGVVSVLSNAYPKETREMINAALSKDLYRAFNLNKKLYKMMKALFIETNPMPIKYVASKLGLCENVLRLPLCSIEEGTEKVLNQEIENLRS
jgi:4-hydroxy-tetrahydrodipicolinate synthase